MIAGATSRQRIAVNKGRGHCPRPFACDGDTDSVDALNILRLVAGLAAHGNGSCPPGGTPSGDVDCDNDIDSVDALQILRFVAGLPVAQNGPCPPIGVIGVRQS